jgi:transposase InsO family protein
MVKKKDGSWRPCGDFRRLNLVTTEDKYPLPNMADLSSRLDSCVIFSKLDLQKGYLQVPVKEDDIPKTAIITPFGLFEFTRMPFGLKNAGMTFQRMMDQIFFDLPCVFVYLDDLLVASTSVDEHAHHLRQVLGLLAKNGLVINQDKCVFGRASLEFLGHQVQAGGISPLPDRVAAVRSFPRPTCVVGLQAFLGLFNYYRRFVPAAARLVRPLTDALQGDLKPQSKIAWSAAMQSAFDAAKAALSATALLDHPSAAAELALYCDASSSHTGAVLQQRRPGQQWRPLGFYSQKLSAAESRYSTFDRELLAVYSSLIHFRHLLEGRHFVVYSDHKPLAGALERVSEPRSDRQRRQLSFIAEFVSEIRYVAGPDNTVADTLSRPPPTAADAGVQQVAAVSSSPTTPHHTTPPPPVSIAEIAAAQPACADCASAHTSSVLRVQRLAVDGQELLVDTSSGVIRPLIPAALRRRVFDAVHGLAHPGVRATTRLISSRFLWPGLAKNVAAWCRNCAACQAAKVTVQQKASTVNFPNTACRFSQVHVDLVGPLPATAGGFAYVLTAVDRATRWLEAFPLRGITAADCAEAFIGGWVARFGVLACLVSDRGVQFASAVWAATMAKLGTRHLMTTAFHPQCNGLVERAHRRLKDALKARLAGPDWPKHLPWVLLGLRAAPREDSGVSAAELVYGAPLSLPGPIIATAEPPPEFFVQQMQSAVPAVATRPAPEAASKRPPSQLFSATHVYVRSPPAAPALSPAYRGPYIVHKRSSKYFILKMGGRYDAISVDRLKPHLGDSPVAAQPPKRGRPTGSAATSLLSGVHHWRGDM